jgi:glycosyltransferase involved in cell wall biosynthesis
MSLRGLWRLVSLLRAERPDILHTWLYHADLIGLIAGRLAGVRAVVWNVCCMVLTTAYRPWNTYATSRLLARLSRLPDVVITNSRAGQVTHEQIGYSPKRWEYIPNGIDTDEFRPSSEARLALREELGLAHVTPLIGLVARYHVMKDHATFLRAASLLRAHRSDVHFVLAGKGIDWSNTVLNELINDLDLRAQVHLLGERDDIPKIMAALDLYVSSSTSEASPNVVAEAMACGVPCVVTDVGDSADIVAETGIVVKTQDAEAIANACTAMMELPEEKRDALQAAARERIESLFSLRRITNCYERLYEEYAKQQG